MFDFLFDSLDRELTPEFIKEIHLQLMAGVMDVPGQWKILGNGVGSVITARPEEVPSLIDRLVSEYNKFEPSLENIVRFHVRFETIHPSRTVTEESEGPSPFVNACEPDSFPLS